jgi:hypothetical protein
MTHILITGVDANYNLRLCSYIYRNAELRVVKHFLQPPLRNHLRDLVGMYNNYDAGYMIYSGTKA